MNDVDPSQFWSISHFNTYYKCDLQVSNICEELNREILEHTYNPIITLLEGIEYHLTKRITRKKELMNKYAGEIFPRIQLILEKTIKL